MCDVADRLEKRGIKANITPYSIGDTAPDFTKFDLVKFWGNCQKL